VLCVCVGGWGVAGRQRHAMRYAMYIRDVHVVGGLVQALQVTPL
jgi:hypothetical protein